jgi:translation elongation factor aEF-1 beta
MSTAVATLTIMPESPATDLKVIEHEAIKLITAFSDDRQKRVDIKPVAFGLQSVNITFLMDEKKGDTESLEKQIAEIPGVQNVELTDIRRIIG